MRIVEHHLHVEGRGATRRRQPDTAEPDDAEGGALVAAHQRRPGEVPALRALAFDGVAIG